MGLFWETIGAGLGIILLWLIFAFVNNILIGIVALAFSIFIIIFWFRKIRRLL